MALNQQELARIFPGLRDGSIKRAPVAQGNRMALTLHSQTLLFWSAAGRGGNRADAFELAAAGAAKCKLQLERGKRPDSIVLRSGSNAEQFSWCSDVRFEL